jgi:hypothetical protein
MTAILRPETQACAKDAVMAERGGLLPGRVSLIVGEKELLPSRRLTHRASCFWRGPTDSLSCGGDEVAQPAVRTDALRVGPIEGRGNKH